MARKAALLSVLLSSTILTGVGASHAAQAQSPAPPANPSTALSTRTFDVPAQAVGPAIAALARQADAQILVGEDLARGRESTAVSGAYTVERALSLLLRDTGLTWRKTGVRSFSVVLGDEAASAADSVALPDILVQGMRQWSLNTGIRRSENDSQPFIVIKGEDIRRSGAPDLETFLRNQLNVNASAVTAEQTNLGNPNASIINLRGLGDRETLVLVDGRRLPGTTNRDGSMGQPSIIGIPMAAIERIEVLASSASGIYGNGATGGVINIIMRRDYRGAELSTTFIDSFDGGSAGMRYDFTGGMSLEEGRTNLTFSGNYTESDPLTYGDRSDLIVAGRRQALGNNPNFFQFGSPLGLTPNIRSVSRRPLQLDPQYGGAVLSSFFTHVPTGFRGVDADGVAGLVANAGSYALDLSENGATGGGGSALLYGAERASASAAVRRDFSERFKAYGELNWTRAVGFSESDRVPTNITLAAGAPNNPFTEAVEVTVPFVGSGVSRSESVSQTYRAVVGGIIQLPGEWQAVVDLSRMRSETDESTRLPAIDPDSLNSFRNGTQDILRDVRLPPAYTYVYQNGPYASLVSPMRNDVTTTSIRAAGPLPIQLPGGRPTLTVSMERSTQDQEESFRAQNSFDYSIVDVLSPGKQKVDSLYGEINIPLFGRGRSLPFVKELLVTLAARYERYEESGSPEANCFYDWDYLPTLDVRSLCPATQPSETTSDNHLDPTFSVRWRPIEDLTLRGSYATGYLTPRINQLVKSEALELYTTARDPLRGLEPIGTEDSIYAGEYFLPGFYGGNANVKPETSRTFTVGMIYQPAFLDGLRLSVDWTRITKRDNYFDPSQLLFPDGDDSRQASFESFLNQYPDRITRGPASDGFSVGPITSIDVSIANLVGSTSESIDFAGRYSWALFGGALDLDVTATYVRELSLQEVPDGPQLDYAGVIGDNFLRNTGGFGALRWKGSALVRWTGDRLGLGWNVRYFDAYYVNEEREFSVNLGSDQVPSQTYHDLTASYAFDRGVTLRGGVNNVFNKTPPLDTVYSSRLYSSFGDPRLANYYVTLVKAF